jgi:hypothetical protein
MKERAMEIIPEFLMIVGAAGAIHQLLMLFIG